VYAMAATLYHAITGKIPQPALDRQANDQLLWPSQLQIQIEPRVEAALMKALSIKASDRFQSMEDFKAALTGGATTFAPAAMPIAAAAAVPIQAASAAPPPPPPPPPVPPTQAQVPPSYIPPTQVSSHVPPTGHPPAPPLPSSSSSSGAKWLWLAIPLALLLIGGAVALTIFLPKFWHKDSVIVQAPTPTVDNTPIPTNPDNPSTPAKDDTNPPANPDDAKPADNAAKDSGTATASDSGTATATDSGTPAADAPPADPGPAYETLTGQGVSFIAAGDSDSAVGVYLQAIKLVPKNPKAYAALGELYLYTVGNLPEALKYYHAAIARGGTVTFHVHHDRGGGNFTVASDGRLRISNGSVGFDSGGGDSFKVPKGEVREAKPNKVVGLFSHGQLSLMAFHIRLATGKNYNFAPGSNFTLPERDLIISLIGKG
jgi:tetratricopeptide (TPR) repeat protein